MAVLPESILTITSVYRSIKVIDNKAWVELRRVEPTMMFDVAIQETQIRALIVTFRRQAHPEKGWMLHIGDEIEALEAEGGLDRLFRFVEKTEDVGRIERFKVLT